MDVGERHYGIDAARLFEMLLVVTWHYVMFGGVARYSDWAVVGSCVVMPCVLFISLLLLDEIRIYTFKVIGLWKRLR